MLGPGDWPGTGEIDILEDVNALSDVSGTSHCGNLTQPNPDGTLGPCHEFTGISSGLLPCPGCQTGYHTYTVIVDRTNPTAEQIRWYIDGRQFFQVSEDQVNHAAWTAAVDHGYSIIFDLAIGRRFPRRRLPMHHPQRSDDVGRHSDRQVRVGLMTGCRARLSDLSCCAKLPRFSIQPWSRACSTGDRIALRRRRKPHPVGVSARSVGSGSVGVRRASARARSVSRGGCSPLGQPAIIAPDGSSPSDRDGERVEPWSARSDNVWRTRTSGASAGGTGGRI
jgi:hypothetical protein